MPIGGQISGQLNLTRDWQVTNLEYLPLLLSLPLLYIAFRRYQAARYIQDIPTTPIASAAQGLVEIKAKTVQLDKITRYVPMLDIPCVWYRYEEIMISDNDEEQVTEVKVSEQRFYVADHTGICAIDPLFAEVHPKKTRDIQDAQRSVIHRVSWIGLDDYIYVLGWMHTLHPAAKTDDIIGERIPGAIEKRYGHLKEQLNRITHSPNKSLPFIISSYFEHLLVNNLRKKALFWLGLFFLSIAFLFVLAQRLDKLF